MSRDEVGNALAAREFSVEAALVVGDWLARHP